MHAWGAFLVSGHFCSRVQTLRHKSSPSCLQACRLRWGTSKYAARRPRSDSTCKQQRRIHTGGPLKILLIGTCAGWLLCICLETFNPGDPMACLLPNMNKLLCNNQRGPDHLERRLLGELCASEDGKSRQVVNAVPLEPCDAARSAALRLQDMRSDGFLLVLPIPPPPGHRGGLAVATNPEPPKAGTEPGKLGAQLNHTRAFPHALCKQFNAHNN